MRNLSSLLKSIKSPQFENALKSSKNNLTTLHKLEKNENLNKIISQTLELFDKLPSDKDAEDELFKINYILYSLFEARMIRAFSSLVLNTTPMNKTKIIADAEKKASSYIATNLPGCKPPEREGYNTKHNPFMLDSKEFKAFSKYVVKHTKKAPVCENCSCRATVFAYPCHCPVGCGKCWHEPEEKVCPVCGENVEEFVEILN